MKRTALLLAPALALCSIASPAHATWNGTQWGMSVDEVIETVGGDAHEVLDRRDTRILGTYNLVTSTSSQEPVDYEVDYYFTEKRNATLTKVRLGPVLDQCRIARASFIATLGEGQVELKSDEIIPDRPPLNQEKRTWDDPGGQGTVTYLSVSFGEELQYCQILFEE